MLPSWHFHYDKETNTLTHEDHSKDYVEGFFGENVDLTAVVGNNGAGKTTMLELIQTVLYNPENLNDFIYGPCEKISVKSSTVIKTLDRSGPQTATPFFTVYTRYCILSRCNANQPDGMERSEMESG